MKLNNSENHGFKRLLKAVILIFTVSCTLPLQATLAEEAKPNGFFSKGLATNTMQRKNSFFGEGKAVITTRSKKTKPADGGLKKQPPPRKATGFGLTDKRSNPMFSKDQTPAVAGAKSWKVLSVGVMLNGHKAEHIDKHLKQLLELSKQANVRAGSVKLIGLSSALSKLKYSGELLQNGGQIEALMKVPKNYNVSYSPTWIIQTSEGQILIEAVASISRYFNSKGEFNENQKPLVGIGATPFAKSGGVSF